MAKQKAKSKEVVPAYPGARGSMTIGGRTFKVAKVLTVPVIRHKEGDTVAIKIIGPMYIGKSVKNIGADGKEVKREPATLVPCLDLNDNDVEKRYILTAVVKGNLNDQFPDDSYVGHSFLIRKGIKAEGKNYRDMEIIEIEE